MAKVKIDSDHWMIQCPGCGHDHAIPQPHLLKDKSDELKKGWTFNGDFEKPTFTPSVKLTWPEGDNRKQECCHFNITDGNIILHGDSTHGKVGTFPLESYGE